MSTPRGRMVRGLWFALLLQVVPQEPTLAVRITDDGAHGSSANESVSVISTSFKSCDRYMSSTGCGWTSKFSCPNQQQGSRGSAQDDNTIGYGCCCGLNMWKQDNILERQGHAHDEDV